MIEDFNLQDLSSEDKDEMLVDIGKTIQKQFLSDLYDILGDKQFDALQASIGMGMDFYTTTLKHLVPNYEEVFELARGKVAKAYKGE